jgi:cytochrome b561
MEAAFKTTHRSMGYAFIVLLVLHVAAALKHHLRDRDEILARMLPLACHGWQTGSRSAGQ